MADLQAKFDEFVKKFNREPNATQLSKWANYKYSEASKFIKNKSTNSSSTKSVFKNKQLISKMTQIDGTLKTQSILQINEDLKASMTNNEIQIIVIGVSGATRSGKGTLSKKLFYELGGKNLCILLCQDQFFDRKTIYQELNGNWEDPRALNHDAFLSKINDTIKKLKTDVATGVNTNQMIKYLILEGFLLFHDNRIVDLMHYKYWLDINKQTCYNRRMRTKRVPENYFHKNLWPCYQKYRKSVFKNKQLISKITQIDGTLKTQTILQIALKQLNIINEEKKYRPDDEEKKHNSNQEILWCDSDPNIIQSATLITQYGFKIKTFNETAKCLTYIKQHNNQQNIKAVITSSMRRGGRKEKGLLDGLQMFGVLRVDKNVWRVSYAPILAVVTAGGLKIDECAENGIKIYSIYDRKAVQERVLNVLGSFGQARKMMRLAFSNPPSASCDEHRTKCWEFLQSLIKNKGGDYFESFSNHCFCNKCEDEQIFYRGNPSEKYVLPIGWYRFGIKIRNDMKKMRLKMENWHVAYHGTPTDRVESIMEHQKIMFPGDKLNNGIILPVRLGACFAEQVSSDGKVIYVSPTIKYSGNYIYAKPKKWKNGLCGQVVFQCRVKPNTYKKFQSTLGNQNFCKLIKDDEIEWITADRTGVAPYAVLVRILPQNVFAAHCMD